MLRVCVGLLVCATIGFAANVELNEHWELFKARYNKRYETHEEPMRRENFERNVKKIQAHNLLHDMGKHSFRLGLNHIADLSVEEYRAMNGARPTNKTHGIDGSRHLNRIRLPASVDWRQKGYVTPVKNQGQCGSCWAFSTTGSLEGAHFRTTSQLVSLSEQNLVDCVHNGNMGCGGGWMDTAFQYIIDNKGIDTEDSYPYTAMDGQCSFSANTVGTTMRYFTDVPKTESALQNSVATIGPVSVAIDANHESFMLYKSGVFQEPTCQQNAPDHAVLVVGYSSENGQDYWIVKNSWDTTWGEQGYIRMARNNNNMCGIANYATYPTV
jgi:cathepsin L